MNEYPFTSLVTLALVLLGVLLANRVSKARLDFSQSDRPSAMQHSVEIYSDPKFMIAFRNQMNLLEHLILFLPTLWIFAFGFSDGLAAVVGLGYFIGRVLYARSYPHSHKVGYTLALISMLVLMIGAVASSLYLLIA
jgi:glutathione S-transferase